MWKRSLTIVSWNAAYKDIRWSRFIKAEEAGYMFFGAEMALRRKVGNQAETMWCAEDA